MLHHGTHAVPVRHLNGTVNRLFGDLFDGVPVVASQPVKPAFPAVNLWEVAERYHVEAELPGYSLEDVEVLVHKDKLTVRGQPRAEECKPQDGASWHHRERARLAFERTFRLPSEVDPDKAQASMRDGILHVTLPKSETARPRRIEVKGARK